MQNTQSYINSNKQRYLDELFELLRIPSVSADPKFKSDVLKAAEYLKKKLADAGMDNTELLSTDGNPIVYGEKIIDASKPTVLVYGHYDVQPADPYELWDSPPFEPVIKNEKIYARGACDDKGQTYMHVKAIEAMIANNELPCNVKVIIEGEEEVGSANLNPFLKKYKDKLKADVVLISDTSMIANDCPSITVGLRGLSYMEVEVVSCNRDLHSGVYGGAVANPINVLAEMIASLKDENKHITIPGFYNDVRELSVDERKALNSSPFNLEEYKKELNLTEIEGEKGYTTLERTSIRPTVDCNGIWGGYQGEGAKTVLPAKAGAKISMRLVPNQSSEKISKMFEEHMKKIAPKSVTVKVTAHHGGEPVITPTDTVAYKAAAKAMEKTFGKTPIPGYEGGSIPIVASFESILGLKTILFGFGLDTDALHSPNENYGLFNFYKGIETIPYFYENYAEMNK
ncbi:MAG TPA: dipeptidase [Bacteroidetes bacterium]|nr:dipeptidase [Bacteroidota bacterium]